MTFTNFQGRLGHARPVEFFIHDMFAAFPLVQPRNSVYTSPKCREDLVQFNMAYKKPKLLYPWHSEVIFRPFSSYFVEKIRWGRLFLVVAPFQWQNTLWPCVSQYVVCVGGTSVRATGIQSSTRAIGDFEQEVPWIGAGAGASAYVAKPAYQGTNVAGNFRGVPDIALASDSSGVGAWVYMNDADFDGWIQVEGTSWATPMAAAITANSNTTSTTSIMELTKLYAGKNTYFTDITTGYCGLTYGFNATVGWDQCTGLGSFYNYK